MPSAEALALSKRSEAKREERFQLSKYIAKAPIRLYQSPSPLPFNIESIDLTKSRSAKTKAKANISSAAAAESKKDDDDDYPNLFENEEALEVKSDEKKQEKPTYNTSYIPNHNAFVNRDPPLPFKPTPRSSYSFQPTASTAAADFASQLKQIQEALSKQIESAFTPLQQQLHELQNRQQRNDESSPVTATPFASPVFTPGPISKQKQKQKQKVPVATPVQYQHANSNKENISPATTVKRPSPNNHSKPEPPHKFRRRNPYQHHQDEEQEYNEQYEQEQEYEEEEQEDDEYEVDTDEAELYDSDDLFDSSTLNRRKYQAAVKARNK